MHSYRTQDRRRDYATRLMVSTIKGWLRKHQITPAQAADILQHRGVSLESAYRIVIKADQRDEVELTTLELTQRRALAEQISSGAALQGSALRAPGHGRGAFSIVTTLGA